MNKYPLIRKIYLYLFALIGLVLIVIGGVRLVGLGLKAYIFTKADTYYDYPRSKPIIVENGKEVVEPTKEELEEFQKNQTAANRQREAAEAIAFIIVGLPLYLYHWAVITRDKKEERSQ